ncbi:MAG: hypothetical protein J0L92_23655 [Deltaproteobacteria bacterium]|nr:hypothetical protein [Deltaproteobacteria bacterium]
MTSPTTFERTLRAFAISPALLGAALALAGCGGGDPFTRVEASFDRTVNDICTRCPQITGTTTESECRTAANANNPFEGAEWNCQRGVYMDYSSELAPTYDCVARAVSGFETCMRNAASTCPPASGTTQACSDQMNTAINACPQPDSIMAAQALSVCFADG